MRWSIVAAISLTALLLAAPALAASQQDREDCDKESMTRAIDACTRVLNDSGTPPTALTYINRAAAYYAMGDYDRSIADYDEAIRREPTNSDALFGRGTAKRRKGDTAGSEADFLAGRTVKAAERNVDRDVERKRSEEISRIATLSSRQRIADTVRQNACNERAMGLIASMRRDNEIADRDFAATGGDPAKLCAYGKDTGLSRLGHQAASLADLQDWASAQSCNDANVASLTNAQMQLFRNYTRAVVSDCQKANLPPPPEAADSRTWFICGTGTMPLETAIAACTDIINKPGELPEGRRSAYIRRAVLRHPTDYDGAIADLDAAMEIAPNSPVTLARRCWARAVFGRDLDKALADCNEAVRLAPDFYGALDSRGLVYLQLGDLDKSIADYDAALDISPALATSRYGRGLAKRRKGDVGGGDTDIALANRVEPGLVDMMARFGVK